MMRHTCTCNGTMECRCELEILNCYCVTTRNSPSVFFIFSILLVFPIFHPNCACRVLLM